ncbi:MAG: RluA family pseudouridine synthase [Holosporales bacterium]
MTQDDFERLDPEAFLLYRDAMILVLNKPAGVAVHPGRGPAPNLEPWLEQLRFGLPHKPQLAHRLDKDTSGCLVLGRHAQALRLLGQLFKQDHLIEKVYWAIVEGSPQETSGTIDLALERQSSKSYHWRMKVCEQPEKGLNARTDYRLLAQHEGFSLVELIPRTGRTHQLRVHTAAMGWPILGDPVYGRPHDPKEPGSMLHLVAKRVSIPLYKNKPPVMVEAPVPPHMERMTSFAEAFSAANPNS